MNPSEVVKLAAKLADDMRAEDIVVLDMKDVTLIADYFMICTGTSGIHTKSIGSNVEKGLKEAGLIPKHKGGYDDGAWILLDLGSVVIHIFQHDTRLYYNLERLWGDARRISI